MYCLYKGRGFLFLPYTIKSNFWGKELSAFIDFHCKPTKLKHRNIRFYVCVYIYVGFIVKYFDYENTFFFIR